MSYPNCRYYDSREVTAARDALTACEVLAVVAAGEGQFDSPEDEAWARTTAGTLASDPDGQRHLRAVFAAYDKERAGGFL
jgi:hypothetical protein